MPRDARVDAVGIGLAQLLRPGAVADVELARGVALRPRRQLLQLEPQDPRALGRARRVDGHGLADRDRRLGREEAAVGLVDGARDAVEPGRQVDDRRAEQALVPLPVGPLGERVVDLHARAPEAVPAPGLGLRRRDDSDRDEPAVELVRRDVADDRAAGEHLAAETSRTPRAPSSSTSTSADVRVRPRLAAGVADDSRERVDEHRAAAARHRHAAELERRRDDLAHEAGRGGVGAESRVEHPRRQQPVRRAPTGTSPPASPARSRAPCR